MYTTVDIIGCSTKSCNTMDITGCSYVLGTNHWNELGNQESFSFFAWLASSSSSSSFSSSTRIVRGCVLMRQENFPAKFTPNHEDIQNKVGIYVLSICGTDPKRILSSFLQQIHNWTLITEKDRLS